MFGNSVFYANLVIFLIYSKLGCLKMFSDGYIFMECYFHVFTGFISHAVEYRSVSKRFQGEFDVLFYIKLTCYCLKSL